MADVEPAAADDPAMEAELRQLIERSERQDHSLDVRADIEWIFHHLGTPVRPLDAPNSGAWALLQSARQEPDWFLSRILPRTLSRRRMQSDSEEPLKVHPHDLELLEDIREMLARSQGKDRL